MITKIINDVIVKEESEKREAVLHQGINSWRSSGLGTCMRGRFLNRLLSGTGIKPEIDPRTLRVFEMGNQVEEWLMTKLKAQNDYDIIQQIEMYDPEYNISGHLDAFLLAKNAMTTPREYICECKSKHSKSFWYMDKKGQGAQVHHKMQLHSYLYMLNKYGGKIVDKNGVIVTEIAPRNGKLEEGAILYVSKDDMALLEYPVKTTDLELMKMWQFEMNTLNKCWDTQTTPPAPEIGSWQEKYCEFCKLGLCGSLNDTKVKELFKVKETPVIAGEK